MHTSGDHVIGLCSDSSGNDSASTTESDENVKQYERELQEIEDRAPVSHRTRHGRRAHAFSRPTHSSDFMRDARFGYLYGREETSPQLRVCQLYPAREYGYGVRTLVDIRAHTPVTPYAGHLVYEDATIFQHPERLTHTIKLLTCAHGESQATRGLLLLHGFKRDQLRHGMGVGSMVNHDMRPNCELVIRPASRGDSALAAFIKAVHDIPAGTELTINYGRHYFER